MVTADEVRDIALALPRAREQLVGGRFKLKVKQIVFAAFSRDETQLGFGFPRDEREALIASDRDTYFLPRPSDLRYQWVCAHLDRLDPVLTAELVTDAWRMCVPKMLHDLPELPEPAMRAWGALDAGDLATARPLVHPYVRVEVGQESIRGRSNLWSRVRERGVPRPPTTVEIRDGQLYRWFG